MARRVGIGTQQPQVKFDPVTSRSSVCSLKHCTKVYKNGHSPMHEATKRDEIASHRLLEPMWTSKHNLHDVVIRRQWRSQGDTGAYPTLPPFVAGNHFHTIIVL